MREVCHSALGMLQDDQIRYREMKEKLRGEYEQQGLCNTLLASKIGRYKILKKSAQELEK